MSPCHDGRPVVLADGRGRGWTRIAAGQTSNRKLACHNPKLACHNPQLACHNPKLVCHTPKLALRLCSGFTLSSSWGQRLDDQQPTSTAGQIGQPEVCHNKSWPCGYLRGSQQPLFDAFFVAAAKFFFFGPNLRHAFIVGTLDNAPGHAAQDRAPSFSHEPEHVEKLSRHEKNADDVVPGKTRTKRMMHVARCNKNETKRELQQHAVHRHPLSVATRSQRDGRSKLLLCG